MHRSVQGRAEDDGADQRDGDVRDRVPAAGGPGAVEEDDAADAQHDVDDDDHESAGGGPEVVVAERLAERGVRQRVSDQQRHHGGDHGHRECRVDRRLEPRGRLPERGGQHSLPAHREQGARGSRRAGDADDERGQHAADLHQRAEPAADERGGRRLQGDRVSAHLHAVVDAEADRDRVRRPQVEDDREGRRGDHRDRDVPARVGGLLAEVGGGLEADVGGDAEDDAVEDAGEPALVRVAEGERRQRLAVAAALDRGDQVDDQDDRHGDDPDDELHPRGDLDLDGGQDQEQRHPDEEEQDPQLRVEAEQVRREVADGRHGHRHEADHAEEVEPAGHEAGPLAEAPAGVGVGVAGRGHPAGEPDDDEGKGQAADAAEQEGQRRRTAAHRRDAGHVQEHRHPGGKHRYRDRDGIPEPERAMRELAGGGARYQVGTGLGHVSVPLTPASRVSWPLAGSQ